MCILNAQKRSPVTEPPSSRITDPHPVLVEAVFGLEPLAGKAVVMKRSGRSMRPSKGCVTRRPHLHPALDHRNRVSAHPDIFPDQGTRCLVIFGDPARHPFKIDKSSSSLSPIRPCHLEFLLSHWGIKCTRRSNHRKSIDTGWRFHK